MSEDRGYRSWVDGYERMAALRRAGRVMPRDRAVGDGKVVVLAVVGLSAMVGGLVGGVTGWLGSAVWWAWGLVFAAVEFVVLCALMAFRT